MNPILRSLPLLALLLAPGAWATCYKVTSVGSATTTATYQIRPGEGVAGAWPGDGACDTCNGSLGLPSVINVSDASFQPDGSLIASSVSPITQYGNSAGYDAERVFFRCASGDAVYEMFSTNADNLYSGWYQGGDSAGNSIGLQSAYRTAWPNVLLRLTHVESGQYFTDVWRERLLTGLDIDSRGFQLVKAKNLSAVRAELFRGPLETSLGFPYSATIASQAYLYTQPAGYIAIKGPGLAYPNVGQTHYGNYNGWHYNWPGAIGLYNTMTLKRYPTCAVTNVTPHVVFPSISIGEINAGSSREMPFQVDFKCQSGVINSTAVNGTALGIKVSAGALAASTGLGLVNSNGGLSYLVSDRYGQPGVAQGVGIRLLRNGSEMNLLANENSAKGSNAAAVGWYPVIGGASNNTGTVSGITQYTETFRARLEKLGVGSMPTVTPGRVEATAQVVIRVQ
ncbi:MULTISPECIES: fimbrial protein [Pseudomonadaceae]|uniref:Fimbrial protein n=1 Tax=Pseudomonas denitrificans TaxID=43306 RepID=A0A9X7N5Z5_PSEDE|nr:MULTISPECIES: fimbrial protein [Pseudomonadaceae]MBD9513598.1 fimbrial protein [Pseudomonas sp. PDM22]MBD9632250.1 fimbrial protein [Pseudomonas sp. PDM19]OQR34723.1 fimbrial protein [Pseudomonas sp. T]QEY75737.1 fimbrial protein [Pseudomonas denitrificans (nom. rej.)]